MLALWILLSVFLITIIFVLFYYFYQKNSLKNKQSVLSFFESDKFSLLYKSALENYLNYKYDFFDEEAIKFYNQSLLNQDFDSIKDFSYLLDVFISKTSKFLNQKLSNEIYLNTIEAYIFFEAKFKKVEFEKIYQNSSNYEDIKRNSVYSENLIISNLEEKTKDIDLFDEEKYNKFNSEFEKYFLSKNLSSKNALLKPKQKSLYEPSKEIVLSSDELIKMVEISVEKMSTSEHLKTINDYFSEE